MENSVDIWAFVPFVIWVVISWWVVAKVRKEEKQRAEALRLSQAQLEMLQVMAVHMEVVMRKAGIDPYGAYLPFASQTDSKGRPQPPKGDSGASCECGECRSHCNRVNGKSEPQPCRGIPK